MTDKSRGPTVERGLTALDALYELRNTIPGLMDKSEMTGQEGELNPFRELVADSTQLGTHFGYHPCWLFQNNV